MIISQEAKQVTKSFLDGIVTGCISTFLFNPIDKALFEMIRDKKSFFDRTLWKNPYNGVGLALYGRIVGYGLYFSFFDLYEKRCKNLTCHSSLNTFIASAATGLTSVALSHPINVIKTFYWNQKTNMSFYQATCEMVQRYRWKVFMRGIAYTCLRDIFFSATFFMLTQRENTPSSFIRETLIIACAAAIASPCNYLRNRHLFNFDEQTPSLTLIYKELIQDLNTETSLLRKAHLIVHGRLNIGLGTIRTGFGMALARKTYAYLKEQPYLG
jgi:hypothetical protein